ncbi:heavy metal-associated isoprenylated plant protein 4 [Magnolia sinica]|uniref:heavy metal-associated isoprenylated plant protein 4 n=1 Tax=Magnolia sinica TaxID=86752 RepID=UPI002657FE5D|nr:heavy metal-associated isoprenylated plant protein 4 [Magnolia sinica]
MAEKKGGDGIISAVYKVNLHCKQCAREIEKPLRKTKGVQKVEVDMEESKITVVGAVDGKKIQELIVKKSKKTVEMVSVEAKKDETSKKEEVALITTVIKVPMHCENCEYDLKRKLVKVKGVRTVKIDSKAQTCTVEGTVESQELIKYVQKKFSHKHPEIIVLKEKKVEEKKEKVKEDGPQKKEKTKEEKKVEKKVEVIWEKKEEEKCEERSAPYFVHCTHAPELFSDENPNACCVM